MACSSASEICTDLEVEVISGRLAPGQRLPSIRERADELGVAPGTVASAYRRLRERGLVVGRGRQGTCVAARPTPAARLVAPVPEGVVDARSGNPDPALLPSLRRALRGAHPSLPDLYGAPLMNGSLADSARRLFEADAIDATHLTVTSGAMDAIGRIITALGLRIGDRIGVEDPGHVPVHELVRTAGLQAVPLPVDGEGIVPAPLRAALDRGLGAVVMTPRAQNPTGGALTRGRAADLAAVLADHPEVAVVEDDHAGPVSGIDYVRLAPPGPRWATIRSLGKFLGPDLRIALVAADRRTVDQISIAVGNGPGWVSHLLQRMAADLLNDPTTTELVQAAAASYRDRRERMIEALDAQGMRVTSRSGLNVWIPVDDEQMAVESVRAAGYAIRAGTPYRISSRPGVRVTVAGLSDMDLEGLARALAHGPDGQRTAPPI